MGDASYLIVTKGLICEILSKHQATQALTLYIEPNSSKHTANAQRFPINFLALTYSAYTFTPPVIKNALSSKTAHFNSGY